MTEQIGFRDEFKAMYDQYGDRDGQPFTVLHLADHTTDPGAIDEEVGRMWRIRFADDHQILAWPEEVELSVRQLREAALSDADGDRLGTPAVRDLLPAAGETPAPEHLWQTVNHAVGKDIRRPLKHGGFEQPNIAECRVALKRWAMRMMKGE